MWDLKHRELCCPQRGAGGFVAICPWHECADPAVTSKQKQSQSKGTASDRGIHTSTDGQTRPGAPWRAEQQKKKLSLNLDATWK